jgi:hypothetical protein
LIAALPEDTAQFDETPAARHLYLPASHAKALHPNTTLIQGMRGSGKSFWFAALQSGDLRALLGSDTGLSAETVVSVGFGQRPLGKQFPSKRTLKSLHESGIDPQQMVCSRFSAAIGGGCTPAVRGTRGLAGPRPVDDRSSGGR